MDNKEIRRANILLLIKEFGSAAKLARQANTAESYLSQIINANDGRGCGSQVARKLETAAGKPTGWLDIPHSENGSNIAKGPEINRNVPLISWVQAGDWHGVEDYEVAEEYEQYPAIKPVGSMAFALRVRGDSMENPSGNPTYPEGSIIIVDPVQDYVPIDDIHGKRVVVKLTNTEAATFKQIAVDSGRVYLKPLNPRYPIQDITDHLESGDAHIVGIVVQTIINE